MNEQEKKPINPNAFPISEADYDRYSLELPPWTGMTLRDYFANSAMQSLISRLGGSPLISLGRDGDSTIELLSKDAYAISDAMLKQREL
jgi:hypothetical protein